MKRGHETGERGSGDESAEPSTISGKTVIPRGSLSTGPARYILIHSIPNDEDYFDNDNYQAQRPALMITTHESDIDTENMGRLTIPSRDTNKAPLDVPL